MFPLKGANERRTAASINATAKQFLSLYIFGTQGIMQCLTEDIPDSF